MNNKILFSLIFVMILLFGTVSALTVPYDYYQIYNTTGSSTWNVPYGVTIGSLIGLNRNKTTGDIPI